MPDSPPEPLSLEITPEAPEGWDELVLSAEGSTFCHLSGWGDVLRESLGLRPRFFLARADGRLVGGMPLYRMPRLGRGHVLISVPYLNYGGPLGGPEVQAALVERAKEEALRTGARGLEIRARRSVAAELPLGREKVTVTLELPEDAGALFNEGFKAKLRSQIRRPLKEGMEVRFGLQERRPFYRVFSRNMRDLGTPVLPHSFFTAISDTFPGMVDFGVVYHQGRPVAAGCGFHFQGEFEMTWASSLREYGRQAPNMLLYWGFMERCIGVGDRVFNFGRCTPGGGTHRFKSQWGGEEEPLSWRQWPAGPATEDSEKGVYRLATRIWRHLPLPVANGLGPVLARRIPTF